MSISIKMKKERNKAVAARLQSELEITVRTVNSVEELKDSNWFIPTRKRKGILKLQVQS